MPNEWDKCTGKQNSFILEKYSNPYYGPGSVLNPGIILGQQTNKNPCKFFKRRRSRIDRLFFICFFCLFLVRSFPTLGTYQTMFRYAARQSTIVHFAPISLAEGAKSLLYLCLLQDCLCSRRFRKVRKCISGMHHLNLTLNKY